MRVAAYQAPIHATNSADVVGLIREQVVWCEANGVEILCCPEAILGGLADYATRAADVAVEGGRLRESGRTSPGAQGSWSPAGLRES